MTNTQIDFINVALTQAKKACSHDEVPIGAVVARNNKVISKAFNKREKSQNALHHAEILAISKACRRLKSWRLDDCELYVTLQPCIMCAGAILNARIKKIYIGTLANKESESSLDIYKSNALNWKTEVEVLHNQESSDLLKKFFQQARTTSK